MEMIHRDYEEQLAILPPDDQDAENESPTIGLIIRAVTRERARTLKGSNKLAPGATRG